MPNFRDVSAYAKQNKLMMLHQIFTEWIFKFLLQRQQLNHEQISFNALNVDDHAFLFLLTFICVTFIYHYFMVQFVNECYPKYSNTPAFANSYELLHCSTQFTGYIKTKQISKQKNMQPSCGTVYENHFILTSPDPGYGSRAYLQN